VNISGGTFGGSFSASAGSDLELIGGEFRLNGANFSGDTISLSDEDVFTGTLADGSSFIFRDDSNPDPTEGFDVLTDVLTDVTLTVVPLPTVNAGPLVINGPMVSGPSGLRSGQTVTLEAGGVLVENYAVVDATLNVVAGILGDSAEASGSVVNISGGIVGEGFEAYSGSEVNISGGIVGDLFDANPGSVVNISGGVVGENFDVFAGSTANGVELDNLQLGQSIPITDRNVTLSGVLADGELFSFDLNAVNFSLEFSYLLPPEEVDVDDFFDPDATLTITLTNPVPEPFLLGDCNQDDFVDFSDIPAFIAILQAGSFLDEADCNRDGFVDFLDIGPFIFILASN